MKTPKVKIFMISFFIQEIFMKIQPNMSEQEKKRQRIYDLLCAETKPRKKFRKYSLWFPSSPHFNPSDYGIFGVLENKTEWNSLSKYWFA